ncbi:hypothetical protein [Limnohabitans sp. 2KL-51]|uniref:hypothetical protein n=1 Tax=Limnohabitans sp. 2KL-51 TaxID=1977911 RepID=UPI0011B22568|nr:hypothetical protein [Limnohabitans sp. 2KL-51]
MNYIIFSSLAILVGILIFTSAFIRIKYLNKVYDYSNKGWGENPDALISKLHRWSKKIAAAFFILISVIIFPLNLVIFLPDELEAIEYGVSGDELKKLKLEHKKLADSDFIDFVESYLKFGQSNAIEHTSARKYNIAVDNFVEARKLNIANYNDLSKYKEAVEQREREKKIAFEAEKKRNAEAEKKRNSSSNYSYSSSTSSSFTREDPRNVYIYCVTGQRSICYTTPAECEAQKVYYGGQCKSAACGTAETVLNTSQCALKGYK